MVVRHEVDREDRDRISYERRRRSRTEEDEGDAGFGVDPSLGPSVRSFRGYHHRHPHRISWSLGLVWSGSAARFAVVAASFALVTRRG